MGEGCLFFGGDLRKLEDAGKGRCLLEGPRELLLEERPDGRKPVCENHFLWPCTLSSELLPSLSQVGKTSASPSPKRNQAPGMWIGESKCSHHLALANGMRQHPGSRDAERCGYILRIV